MKPTEVLVEEHRVILQVLACLESMAAEAEGTGVVQVDSAEKAIDFFRHFADECHHGKEEDHLFPFMEAKGFPREFGPTAVMRHEHVLGRQRIQGMQAALHEYRSGNAAASRRFAHEASGYVALLREHIWKENHRLFPMADQVLTPQDQNELMSRFESVEDEEMGHGTHEKYLNIANELADRYRVPRVSMELPSGVGCCHGHSCHG